MPHDDQFNQMLAWTAHSVAHATEEALVLLLEQIEGHCPSDEEVRRCGKWLVVEHDSPGVRYFTWRKQWVFRFEVNPWGSQYLFRCQALQREYWPAAIKNYLA